jgi:hypothetical protein
MDERPPPSPAKLRTQFKDWTDETELPGRTMSYLKTGFLLEVLEANSDVDGIDTMLEAWATWEAGTQHPSVVLEILRDNGIDEFLAGLTES